MRGRGLRRRVKEDLDRLDRALGRPPRRPRRPPLDELILTILSQNTSDLNRDRAYRALRRRFPSWEGVLRARAADVEETIRVGGLARTKSRVIQEVLRRIRRERGALSLDHLRTMPMEDARAYLRSFRGVGEKTARCVLLFSCGRPVFPVDTHIHRIARRLGWVPAAATPERTHQALAALIPSDRCHAAHVNLITLGRRTCRPRDPSCPSCPLRPGCRFAAGARQARARGDRARSSRPRPKSARRGPGIDRGLY